jgi:hypothetical protein
MKKSPRRGPKCKSKTFLQKHFNPTRPTSATANRSAGLASFCPPANRLRRLRGLKGCNSGRSGPCLTLGPEERQAIEDRLSREGRL